MQYLDRRHSIESSTDLTSTSCVKITDFDDPSNILSIDDAIVATQINDNIEMNINTATSNCYS